MKSTTYRQCALCRQDGDREIHQTAYIPTKFAKTGNVLKIKDDADEWVDGWEVLFCYSEIDDVVDVRQSFKRHKRNTGDSLPKK